MANQQTTSTAQPSSLFNANGKAATSITYAPGASPAQPGSQAALNLALEQQGKLTTATAYSNPTGSPAGVNTQGAQPSPAPVTNVVSPSTQSAGSNTGLAPGQGEAPDSFARQFAPVNPSSSVFAGSPAFSTSEAQAQGFKVSPSPNTPGEYILTSPGGETTDIFGNVISNNASVQNVAKQSVTPGLANYVAPPNAVTSQGPLAPQVSINGQNLEITNVEKLDNYNYNVTLSGTATVNGKDVPYTFTQDINIPVNYYNQLQTRGEGVDNATLLQFAQGNLNSLPTDIQYGISNSIAQAANAGGSGIKISLGAYGTNPTISYETETETQNAPVNFANSSNLLPGLTAQGNKALAQAVIEYAQGHQSSNGDGALYTDPSFTVTVDGQTLNGGILASLYNNYLQQVSPLYLNNPNIKDGLALSTTATQGYFNSLAAAAPAPNAAPDVLGFSSWSTNPTTQATQLGNFYAALGNLQYATGVKIVNQDGSQIQPSQALSLSPAQWNTQFNTISQSVNGPQSEAALLQTSQNVNDILTNFNQSQNPVALPQGTPEQALFNSDLTALNAQASQPGQNGVYSISLPNGNQFNINLNPASLESNAAALPAFANNLAYGANRQLTDLTNFVANRVPQYKGSNLPQYFTYDPTGNIISSNLAQEEPTVENALNAAISGNSLAAQIGRTAVNIPIAYPASALGSGIGVLSNPNISNVQYLENLGKAATPLAISYAPGAALEGAGIFGGVNALASTGTNLIYNQPVSSQSILQSFTQGAKAGEVLGPAFEAASPYFSNIPGVRYLAGNPALQETFSTLGSVGGTNALSLASGQGLASQKEDVNAAIQGAAFPLVYGLANNLGAEIQKALGTATESIPAGTVIGRNGENAPVSYAFTDDGTPIRIVGSNTEEEANIAQLRSDYEGKTLPAAVSATKDFPNLDLQDVEISGKAPETNEGAQLRGLNPQYYAPGLPITGIDDPAILKEIDLVQQQDPLAAQKIVDYINSGHKFIPTMYGAYIGIGNPADAEAVQVSRINPRAVVLNNAYVDPEFAIQPGESLADYSDRILGLTSKLGIAPENYAGQSEERQLTLNQGSVLHGEGPSTQILVRTPPTGIQGDIPIVNELYTQNTYVPVSKASILPGTTGTSTPEPIVEAPPKSTAVISPTQLATSFYDPLTAAEQQAIYNAYLNSGAGSQTAQQIINSLLASQASQAVSTNSQNAYLQQLSNQFGSNSINGTVSPASSGTLLSNSLSNGISGSSANASRSISSADSLGSSGNSLSPSDVSALLQSGSLSPSDISNLYNQGYISPALYNSLTQDSIGYPVPYDYKKYLQDTSPDSQAQLNYLKRIRGQNKLNVAYPLNYTPSITSLLVPGVEAGAEAQYSPLAEGLSLRPVRVPIPNRKVLNTT